jgi:hypothetical protein
MYAHRMAFPKITPMGFLALAIDWSHKFLLFETT